MNCVILSSGLWPTKDENGLIDLADSLKTTAFLRGNAFYIQHWQDDLFSIAREYDTICMVGHSNGGTAVWETAQKLKAIGKSVKSLLLLEPVPYFWWVFGKYVIPDNVEKALCIKKVTGLPPSCYIRNVSANYQNFPIDTHDHGGFPKLPQVRDRALKFIESCYSTGSV